MIYLNKSQLVDKSLEVFDSRAETKTLRSTIVKFPVLKIKKKSSSIRAIHVAQFLQTLIRDEKCQ